ncbi:MAG TPA: hypothetical protein VK929_07295 [Longimicrobiales bacterium]|nr:hypothetical protein [Longimicrobiales bacterium]
MQRIVVIVCGLLTSCAMARSSTSDVDGNPYSAEIFRAAVLELLQGGSTVLVDPRPIPIGGDVGPRESDFYPGLDDIVRDRMTVLEELGVEMVAGFPLIPNCHGLMSAPPGQRVVHGCPEEFTVVVLADTIGSGPEPGQWTLRVLPTYYRPGAGRDATVTDLIIARRGPGFAVIDKLYSAIFERN